MRTPSGGKRSHQLLAFMRHSVAHGFLGDAQMAFVRVGDDARRLLDQLNSDATRAGMPDDFTRI